MASPSAYTFVDVETTGMSPKYDRIIEIGLIRVAANRIRKTFQTVVNPGVRLPPEITVLTGIRAADLTRAPAFGDIAEKVYGFFTDSVIVAHNARFDYRFLVEEFRRLGIPFRNETIDTVRLFRKLYPGKRSYSLDSMIETFMLHTERRHRAFDDARVLWDFFRIIKKTHDADEVSLAIDIAMRRPSFPSGLSRDTVDRLPESPGVYVFRGTGEIPLYIGKAKNLKERIISHFHDTDTKELSVASQVVDIDTFKTAGELSALVLEKEMVRKLKPLYNRKLRAGVKRIVLLETETRGYKSVSVCSAESVPADDYQRILGVFSSRKQIETHLDLLSEKYELCPKLLGIDPSTNGCFRYSLSKCRGACVGKEMPLRYNMRFVQAFADRRIKAWPFDGPVILTEESNGLCMSLFIDRWSILGKSDDPEHLPTISPWSFDPDIYTILKHFILSNKRLRNLHITRSSVHT